LSQVAILTVHGVGTQGPDFDARARDVLDYELRRLGHKLHFERVHWAPVYDTPESRLLKEVLRHGADRSLLRRLSVGAFGDALSYRPPNKLSAKVHSLFCERLEGAEHVGGHIVVLAHSLGALIALDVLRARRPERLCLFASFGSNLPLFHLGVPFEPVAGLKWVNYFDRDDFLGFPCNPLDAQCEDKRVNVGNFFTRWNGMSHLAYWDDKRFLRTVAKDIHSSVKG
jgi:hypothetical protein